MTKELRDKIADLILAEATPEEFVALFKSQLRESLREIVFCIDGAGEVAGDRFMVEDKFLNKVIARELKKLDD